MAKTTAIKPRYGCQPASRLWA